MTSSEHLEVDPDIRAAFLNKAHSYGLDPKELLSGILRNVLKTNLDTRMQFLKADEATKERFWDKVNKKDSEECWIWTASKNQYGKGIFGFLPQPPEYDSPIFLQAHVISYMWSNEEIIFPKQVVRHKCGTNLCVNPNHLEVGMQADNIADAYEQGNYGRVQEG